MRSISKLLGLSMMLLAVPALAQTIDGGQGIACTFDTDCGNICGWVCSFDVTPHICVPAVTQAKAGQAGSEGWCNANATPNEGCACAGQTCSGTYCTPVAFAGNGSAPLCVCDSDCPSGQHCDGTLEMCAPVTTGACNYDAECGCGCFCASGGGAANHCECTGGIPGSCSTSADCGPECSGFSCVGGNCVHDEASCLTQSNSSSSSSSSGSISTSGSSGSSGNPSSATTSANSSSGGSSSSAGASSTNASGGTSSSSSSSSGSAACFQVGTACAANTDCCNQYCDTGMCKCNKAETPGKYPCVTQSDCCSGSCTGGLCVGGAASTTNGSSAASSSAAGSSSSGSSSSSGGASTSSKSGGGGCSTGAGGSASLALLALGLVALSRRKRS